MRKRRKKIPEETPRLSSCGECGRTTASGGTCAACVLRLRAEEAAALAPPPPPPPLEPEPPPTEKHVFLGAHPGCFRCQREGRDLVCPSCRAVLFGVPGNRDDDPVLKYPKPLSAAGW